jgi:alkylated DNA repair dioxygenase AlkB
MAAISLFDDFPLNTTVNLLPKDGEVLLYKNLFSELESKQLMERLLKKIDWRQDNITLFGRTVVQPRLTAWYGVLDKPYTYSGLTMKPQPWTEDLLFIKDKIEPIAGVRYTSVLLNLYRNGQDSMGWHSDDEPELGKKPTISSVSFGAERIFKLKHKKEKSLSQSVLLTNGSHLLMKGETQHYWMHAIPKTRKPMQPRINLTFRVIS